MSWCALLTPPTRAGRPFAKDPAGPAASLAARRRSRSNTLAGAAAWLLLGAGCSDLGEPIRLVPRPEVSATSLDFGTVAVNGSATRSVVIANTGNASLTGSASVSCADYVIDSGGGAFTVPPSTQHTVVVSYHPTGVGSSPCQLLLGAGLPTVDLVGAGALQLPGAQCVLSKTSIDFGALKVGTSKLDVFTIRNPGTQATALNVVPTCGAFQVISGGGARQLAPGDSLVVTLSFGPTAGGATACAVATGPGCPDLPVTGFGFTISFATDIKPIMQARACVNCHGWTAADQLVDAPSSFYPPNILVIPFDPPGSLVYRKITGTQGGLGARMPQGGPFLSQAEIDKFRDWILEGARDN